MLGPAIAVRVEEFIVDREQVHRIPAYGRGSPRSGRPAVKEPIGRLLPTPRATADYSLQLGVHGDVADVGPDGGKACARKVLAEFSAGEELVIGQRALDDGRGACHDPGVETHHA